MSVHLISLHAMADGSWESYVRRRTQAYVKLTPPAPERLGKLADMIGAVQDRAPMSDLAPSSTSGNRYRNRRIMDIQPDDRGICMRSLSHS
jgi:hypothetical protein